MGRFIYGIILGFNITVCIKVGYIDFIISGFRIVNHITQTKLIFIVHV